MKKKEGKIAVWVSAGLIRLGKVSVRWEKEGNDGGEEGSSLGMRENTPRCVRAHFWVGFRACFEGF